MQRLRSELLAAASAAAGALKDMGLGGRGGEVVVVGGGPEKIPALTTTFPPPSRCAQSAHIALLQKLPGPMPCSGPRKCWVLWGLARAVSGPRKCWVLWGLARAVVLWGQARVEERLVSLRQVA